MNATAMLFRMFDRWYRRQIACQHLLGQVRVAGRPIGAGRAVPPGPAGQHGHGDSREAVSRGRHDG